MIRLLNGWGSETGQVEKITPGTIKILAAGTVHIWIELADMQCAIGILGV